MRQGFPLATRGMTIGLLGGSFDPAHEGHVHITREALKRIGLDRVWWLVSPGNPLKARQPAPLQARLARARQLMQDPRVEVTDLEARLGTRFTADTITRLRALYPGVHFVWLMGADNLASFHKWDRWRGIMEQVPVGILARPGAGLRARLSPAAQIYSEKSLARGETLARARAPAWVFVTLPMHDASSTEIRAKGHWTGAAG
ncbi:nicotinate-nucleotide adenylyltransferase [Pseudogemmobacter faecipullorum]|uniref:Probable nicotinate-nucleotide adenylyltransferase n=1 Tax=Pseudogemmobacter faecipullorum TaxID=2755041 RepID=A0ABS8CI30_9RHOB|nr:nicotinate-nucleotide adenylyltransferase [Pseudogemmobacter faecipullorum]MCB5409047.1 nicotinate-nucleotide adenylyltransferase [Pseudogemmobacter faecipullorum]